MVELLGMKMEMRMAVLKVFETVDSKVERMVASMVAP